MKFRSLRLKLTAFVILLLSVTTVVFSIATTRILSQTILDEIAAKAEMLGQTLASAAAYHLISGDMLGMDDLVFKGKGSKSDIEYVAILDKKSNILAHSDLKERGKASKNSGGVVIRKNQDGAMLKEIVSVSGKLFESYTPILFQGKALGAVVVGMNQSALPKAQHAARKQIFTQITFILLVAIAAVVFLSVLITRPVKELSSAVENLRQGRWAGPLRVRSVDELGQLTGSFNNMSKTIMDQKEKIARYLDDLRIEKQRFEMLSENAPFGMVVLEKAGRFRYVNPKFSQWFGYTLDELPDGKTWFMKAYPDPDYRQSVISYWINDSGNGLPGEKSPKTFTVTCKDGSERIANFISVQLGTGENLIACEDITERTRVEREMASIQEQFRQSQKMEAVGKLAGGIAHDFNNLLTVIKGYSQLSRLEAKQGTSLCDAVEQIETAADRAADLTRQLLAFSRRQVMEMRVIDLSTALRDLDKILRRVLGEDVQLTMLLEENLGKVKMDVGQLGQVVMNLAVNARDAMPSGGALTIRTANAEYPDGHSDVSPGRYVTLSVNDTGMGMTEEVKQQAFEPFFTTKERGKGTGLGLSTVYGIVKQSGGQITLESEPGRGTNFTIYLSPVDEMLEQEGRSKGTDESLPLGNETILVVEDEEKVRKLAIEILGKQGYKALEASRGDEALRVHEKHQGPIHLMLVDVVMPGMNGFELGRKMASLRPDTKTLYMSGYTDHAIIDQEILKKGMNYIQKPFTVEGLTRKIRDVLRS
jgi:PAS domain S-box-containing protein